MCGFKMSFENNEVQTEAKKCVEGEKNIRRKKYRSLK